MWCILIKIAWTSGAFRCPIFEFFEKLFPYFYWIGHEILYFHIWTEFLCWPNHPNVLLSVFRQAYLRVSTPYLSIDGDSTKCVRRIVSEHYTMYVLSVSHCSEYNEVLHLSFWENIKGCFPSQSTLYRKPKILEWLSNKEW